MKIAIVNDMVMAIEAMKRALLTVKEYQVIWVAKNGAEAVRKCAKNKPDLILMDLLMPVMDGVAATREIMQQSPCAILIVTSSVKSNSHKVFEALGVGALDAVKTPILGRHGNSEIAEILLTKIAMIGKLINNNSSTSLINRKKPSLDSAKLKQTPLIVIGSSTGGPKALATILQPLPEDFPATIVVVQHIDVQFAGGLVAWLDSQTALTVEVATSQSRFIPGKVLLAASNDHLYLRSNLRLDYTKFPLEYPYRPSVDVFFKSVANHWKNPGIAILLTGMGKDGAEGLKLLHNKGWHTIAQNQASCVVYGMPKAAIALQAATEILDLKQISQKLKKYFPSLL